MKKDKKRGIPLPTHIIVSGLLLLIQLVFLMAVIYDYTATSTWLYTFTIFLGIITVISIISKKGNPDHKISWIVLILVFPIFGVTVYLMWGGGRMFPKIKRRMLSCDAKYKGYLKANEEVLQSLKYSDMLHSRQADYLIGEAGYPVYNNSSCEYFSPIEAFMPRLLEELGKAQKYIFIEFFIIAEGKMWDAIHEILKSKAKEGVEVKIIFDDFGSMKRQRKGFLSKLRSEKIQVAAFNPINPLLNRFLNNRDHRKIIIIDGRAAFTGGFNIGDEYINMEERFGLWKDSGILIKGEAVNSFLSMFCASWEFTTKKPIKFENYACEASDLAEGFVIPYADDPLNSENPAEGIYMQILNTANKYVYIATPYLVIDNAMKTMLIMAAKSGVDVRIVTPHIPDKWYVHNVTQYHYSELLEAGVKIYEYTPGFIHSKLFVSDDKVATVGTVNMDFRSFVFHFECGAWLCDNTAVAKVKEDMLNVLAASREIDAVRWQKRPISRRIFQAILHLFAPLM